MGDYDLTPVGPWYGDKDSNIPDTIASIERLKQIPATIRLTCHGTGIFEQDPADIRDQYLDLLIAKPTVVKEQGRYRRI